MGEEHDHLRCGLADISVEFVATRHSLYLELTHGAAFIPRVIPTYASIITHSAWISLKWYDLLHLELPKVDIAFGSNK